MIESWEQFFGAVFRMREHQKVYFQTNDPIAKEEARKLEELVDDCIAARKARAGDKGYRGGGKAIGGGIL
ncbi:MAG: hypothetical protein LBG57_02415 [Treponema sp.]|jgi:hypothetical protein|nr:hypothetical protein [Treponema sp.]